jgi:hypothetical protein
MTSRIGDLSCRIVPSFCFTIPGLKLDNPRQLALKHALVRFAYIAAGSTFTPYDDRALSVYPYVLAALQISADQYSLASLRYDLSTFRK